jgi:hypothetical protein
MPRRKKGGEEGIKISSTIYQEIQPFDKTIVNEQIAKKKINYNCYKIFYINDFKNKEKLLGYLNKYDTKNRELLNNISKGNYGIFENTEILNLMKNKFKLGGNPDAIAEFSTVFLNGVRDTNARLQQILDFNQATKMYDTRNRVLLDYDTIGHSITQYKNDFIELLLTNFQNAQRTNEYINNTEICDIIDANQLESIEKLELTVDIYDVTNIDHAIQGRYIFQKHFIYHNYNKSLILGYENGLYYNKENYQPFIDRQAQYLSKLNIINKRAIRDFTKQAVSSDYISAYNFNRFDIAAADKYIGDSFAYFICMYIINFIDIEPHLRANIGIIEDFLNNYKTDTLPKGNQLCHQIYYQVLTNEDWKIILNMYLTNLNLIIYNAPKVETNLFVYRGAANNYMQHDDTVANTTIYNSTQISSYSINYEAAKEFYLQGMAGGGDNATMFRVLITPDTNALFVAPLSDGLHHEMEIITLKSQLLSVYNLDHIIAPDDAFKAVEDGYNNINNTNCLSLDDRDKINTHKFLRLIPFISDDNFIPDAPTYIPRPLRPDGYAISLLPYDFTQEFDASQLLVLPGNDLTTIPDIRQNQQTFNF